MVTLTTVDMLCQLQLWDEFLPQVKLMLNLLRFSRRDPNVSDNQELYGAFDFNKSPLAPLGTKALIYDDPTTSASWAPHATNGFYVGPGAWPLTTTGAYVFISLQLGDSVSRTHDMAPIHYTLTTSSHIGAR